MLKIIERKFFGGKFAQILATLSATLTIVSDGMNYAWTGPVVPLLLERDDAPVKITNGDVVWLENIFMFGGFAGLPLTVYIVDKIGRRNSVIVSASLSLIAWVITGFAFRVEHLFVSRFVCGIGANIAIVAAPMYIGEITESNIRGLLGSCAFIMQQLGIVLVYTVAPFVTVPVSSAVGASFVLLALVTLPIIPRSPYHLVLIDRVEDARKSLKVLRGSYNVDEELDEIVVAVQRQKEESARLVDLVTLDSNRRALIIMTVVNGAQHMSGFSAIVMNLDIIMSEANSDLSPVYSAILFSLVLLFATIIAAAFIDRAGRRTLLVSSSILSSLSVLCLAIYFTVKDAGIDISSYTWLPAASVTIFAAVFKYGLGIVPIVLAAELFPTSIKSIGMSVADAIYVVFCIVSIYMYQYLTDIWGNKVPLFIFSVCSFLAALFSHFYVPETKGKTLEEVQFVLKDMRSKSIKKDTETCSENM